MINNRNVLAVVPARGGSKGIPLKNLREIDGVPMVARAGLCARDVPELDRIVVSTDHEEIARVAESAGIAAPFRRPPDLSGDRIGDLEVLRHALIECERLDNMVYDIVVMLQPTSPLREPAHVSDTIQMLAAGNWDAVWTVSMSDSKAHPLKQLTITDDRLGLWDPDGAGIIARQQLTPVYHRNGIAYAITRACLLEQETIFGVRTGALVLDEHLISIDTEWDIEMVEYLLRRNKTRTSPSTPQ